MSSPSPALARAPRVETGTALAEAPDRAADFAAELEGLDIDPATWTGAFATNVWGGRYEIDGVLAAGGQGTTFAGTDRKTGARVAVKVFDLKRATDWKKVDLFEREVRTLKKLRHPQMPSFIDLLEDDDTGVKALVMTHLQGRSLRAVIDQEGALEEAELWRVLVDVAEILEVLHGQASPIVHRDLKPANLLRRGDGKTALVDFGGVGTVRGDKGSTVVGTFGYMAPEQLYGHSSPATDLYALGATVLTLATGKEPEDLPRKGLALDVDKAAPRLSPDLRALLSRMLSPDPEDRPDDGQALAAELGALAKAGDKARRKKRAQDRKAADDVRPDDPKTEAQWPAPPETDLDEVGSVVAAVVSLVVGFLGTAAFVVLGEVILPLVFTVIAAFSAGEPKRKLLNARAEVRKTSRESRKGFERLLEQGARSLQEVDHRQKRRRVTGSQDQGRDARKRRHRKGRRGG